jgi:hypothetical protein
VSSIPLCPIKIIVLMALVETSFHAYFVGRHKNEKGHLVHKFCVFLIDTISAAFEALKSNIDCMKLARFRKICAETVGGRIDIQFCKVPIR